jgi:hypothetical protein
LISCDQTYFSSIEQQTDKISQQPENWENRNGPDRRTDNTTAKRKRTNSDVQNTTQKTTDLAI